MEKIIFTYQGLQAQLQDFFAKYPSMKIKAEEPNEIILSGSIDVFRNYNGFTVNKNYLLEIVIPIGSDVFPYVVDIGNHIDSSYHHYYCSSKQLCLETDAKFTLRFIDGFSLVEWMEEFVEVYYFSYEYYSRFGVFPFGERSHNELGILETYKDYFSTNDIVDAYKILNFICSSPYRGHYPCPCGSNLRLRNCHGNKMLLAYKDASVMAQIQKDYRIIDKYVRELVKKHEEQTK